MCGIFGYIGLRDDAPAMIIEGLRRLEYRGYDSAGLIVINKAGEPLSYKTKGGVAELVKDVDPAWRGNIGLGHTRWATHGEPNQVNAHPHTDCQKDLWLIHNGIIENYLALKQALQKKGHKFISETDTEVITHLIEDLHIKQPLFEAVQKALAAAKGAYAIAVLSAKDPARIVVGRLSSPLLLGLGKKAMFLASDAAALVPHTKKIVYLEDGEIAEITGAGYKIKNIKKGAVKRAPTIIDWNIEEAEKGGYPHFFLKEIFEQPEAIMNSLRGRLLAKEGRVKLGGLESVLDKLAQTKRITFVGCGTAAVACLIGKYLLEDIAGVMADFEIASEYRYRNPVTGKKNAVFAISQSGETIDTLAAIRLAKSQGALTLGLVNVVGSSIARETAAGVYNHVGPEISVASTKAFTSQITILALVALLLGRQRGLKPALAVKFAKELEILPQKVRAVLKQASKIETLAKKYTRFNNALFLGRRYSYPVALEGAIKVKEITYLHAEGMAGGEPKHHSIAMINEDFLAVAIAPKDSVYEKTMNNIKEIKARWGPILAITTEGNRGLKDAADDVIYVPETLEPLSPILSVIPLQLLAYYIGVARGVNLDKPRNLAKSVTVE